MSLEAKYSQARVGRQFKEIPTLARFDFDVEWSSYMNLYVNFLSDRLDSYSTGNSYKVLSVVNPGIKDFMADCLIWISPLCQVFTVSILFFNPIRSPERPSPLISVIFEEWILVFPRALLSPNWMCLMCAGVIFS